MKNRLCPICRSLDFIHGNDYEVGNMNFIRPRGAQGQQVTRSSGGWFECPLCGFVCIEFEVDVIDALLKIAEATKEGTE
jgi:hypothetical protein